MNWVAVGRYIRRVRSQAGFTQEQLAERIDISTSFLGHIERGTRVPSVETLYNLCQALSISMDSCFPDMLTCHSEQCTDAQKKQVAMLLQLALEVVNQSSKT